MREDGYVEENDEEPIDPSAFTDTHQLRLRPYDYQEILIRRELPARYNFAAWGTKAGKTTSGVMRMVRSLWETEDQNFRWIAPYYRQSEIARKRILKVLPKGYYDYAAKTQTITGPSGSTLSFHSGDRPDTIPGEDCHGVIIDEASRVKEDVYNATLSTVLATRGWILAISTPRGKNWFYQECKKGWEETPGYWFARFTSAANPTMDRKTLADTERAMPKFVYDEMVMAKFISSATGTFPDLMACSTGTLPRNAPEEGRQYIIAMDVGKIRDNNVITIWDALDGALVHWAIATGRDYSLIIEDVSYLSKLWNDAPCIIERNGPGEPIIDTLKARGVPMVTGPQGEPGHTTTAGNKPLLVHQWSMALRNGEPMLPSPARFPELHTEHANFEYSISPAGNWTFEAATGHHDDIVMSCLLGWWAITNYAQPKWWRADPGSVAKRLRKVDTRDVKVMN